LVLVLLVPLALVLVLFQVSAVFLVQVGEILFRMALVLVQQEEEAGFSELVDLVLLQLYMVLVLFLVLHPLGPLMGLVQGLVLLL
jgi:hypothetical protein